MRKIIIPVLFLSLAISIASCGTKKEDGLDTDLVSNPATADGEVDEENAPKFQFEKDTNDFGSIIQGEKVSYSFKFKNTGKSDLIISSASGSCGCTVPNYPKEPIAPGAEGTIDVTFNSEGKHGSQTKTVTIIANTMPNTSVLTIKGEVKETENQSK